MQLDSLIEHADILKVSDEDLNWIILNPVAMNDKVLRIHEMGLKVVILTKRREGASAFVPGGEIIEAAAQPVKVDDTVGADDAFNAGVLSKLAEKGFLTKDALAKIQVSEMKQALEHGARVAAVTVSRPGANSPWAHELAEAK